MNSSTEIITIGTTELILIDYSLGHGKVIISDTSCRINTSYEWGAMGKRTLKEFLLEIDCGYFLQNLGPSGRGPIDMKRTMRNVREHIKKECSLAWYMDLEYNKELRYALRKIQNNCDTEEYFVQQMCDLKHNGSLDPRYCEYKYEAEEVIGSLTSEPWHFIQCGDHWQTLWLKRFFSKMREVLNKSVNKNELTSA